MCNEDTNGDTFTFEERHLERFAAGIADLAKTADKLGVPPITHEVIGREVRTETDTLPDGTRVQADVTYVTVRTHGTTPMLPGGWQYVGTVEHMPDGLTEDGRQTANILHGDDPALSAYRNADADCDHCGYVRQRAKTIIVRSEDGAVVQLGTACLKDYLGFHGDAARLAMLVQWYEELRRDINDADGTYRERCADGALTDTFLAAVSACVRVHGFVPKSAYRGFPTAELVRYVLGERTLGKHDSDIATDVRAVSVTDADKAEAKMVRTFALSIPEDTTDNYLGNVRAALSADYVQSRHYGIAASAVSARRKAEERQTAHEVREGKRAASVHVGTVGKREDFHGITVTFVRAFDNDYGTSYLVEMEDENGNILKTFSSGRFGQDAERGQTHEVIRGTVKAHDVWERNDGTSIAQTMLTRVAIPK